MIFADVIAHLHGGLGYAGNLVAVLLEVGEVAEDEDFRQAGRIEPIVDEDAAALVDRGAQHLAEGRRLHAGGPQGNRGLNALAVCFDPAGADVR